jgi:hypothetical protein
MGHRTATAAMIVGFAATATFLAPADHLALSAEAASRAFSKMMVVVLENTDYDDAIKRPFMASLIKRGLLLTNFTAEAHPSQPNYIALVSGSTYGVTSDTNVDLDQRHIGDLLEAKGLQWKVYAEGYPGGCFLGARSGTYVRKHVPFLSFKNVQSDQTRCARIVNASAMVTDIHERKLPDFSLVIPDLNDDAHDTGVAYADGWLSGRFGLLLDDPRFTDGLLLIITFDESRHTLLGKNHVATILIGDAVTPDTRLDDHYSHYSILRLIEDHFGLGTLGQNDAEAAPIVVQ